MSRPAAFVRDNALTLTFLALLLAALVGQSISGVEVYNAQQLADGGQQISWAGYLASSEFTVDVAENWQSEYLQFALYIVATVWLVQCGSSESKQPEEIGIESDAEQKVGRYADKDSPRWARAGGLRTAVYGRSLGMLMPVFLPRLAACPVDRRPGSVQPRSAAAAGGSDQLGGLPRLRGLLEPHPAELAVGVPGGGIDGGVRDLPAPARIPRVQAGRRAARGHRTDRLTGCR
jgi:hypothetical protein